MLSGQSVFAPSELRRTGFGLTAYCLAAPGVARKGKAWRPGGESNPRMSVLQTEALPLCYPAPQREPYIRGKSREVKGCKKISKKCISPLTGQTEWGDI
jgi:hypothetical protein